MRLIKDLEEVVPCRDFEQTYCSFPSKKKRVPAGEGWEESKLVKLGEHPPSVLGQVLSKNAS